MFFSKLWYTEVFYKFFVDILQDQPSGRILELSILHLAMSEMAVLGTRHQIVINEVSLIAPVFSISSLSLLASL